MFAEHGLIKRGVHLQVLQCKGKPSFLECFDDGRRTKLEFGILYHLNLTLGGCFFYFLLNALFLSLLGDGLCQCFLPVTDGFFCLSGRLEIIAQYLVYVVKRGIRRLIELQCPLRNRFFPLCFLPDQGGELFVNQQLPIVGLMEEGVFGDGQFGRGYFAMKVHTVAEYLVEVVRHVFATLPRGGSVKDNEFWEEIWLLIQRFVRFLVTEYKGSGEGETIKEVSMEAALSIQEQLERGKLKPIASASHLLNSLQMTCRNKFRESLRAEERKREEALLEEEDWLFLECQKENVVEPDGMDGRFAYLLEVNEKSEYDVCCALADVLSYGRGEVYAELVEGMQETVQAMSLLYVENKRYEEIAQMLYGKFNERQLATLRKTVSRGKEYLKKKMTSLIVIYKRRGEVPFVVEEED